MLLRYLAQSRRSSLRRKKNDQKPSLQLDGDPVPDDDPEYFRLLNLTLAPQKTHCPKEIVLVYSTKPAAKKSQTGICSGSVNTKYVLKSTY